MRNILITGITGFIGSHLAMELLQESDVQLFSLARSRKGVSAFERVVNALSTACRHSGRDFDQIFKGSLQKRITVLKGDLNDDGLVDSLSSRHYDEIWHCGAKLVFSDSLQKQLLGINYDGTRRMLDLALMQPNTTFNYISTAYVHGDCTGKVYEKLTADTVAFNNHYEASKRYSERMIHDKARQAGMAYRIFRPSIVVGNSETGKCDTTTGVYGFILLAARLKEELDGKMPGFFERYPIRIYSQLNTGLNIIPVDRVVRQMYTISRKPDSENEIYHIVSDNTISIEQLAQQTERELGISFIATSDEATLGPVDHLVNRNVEQFAPYLKNNYLFDNSHVRAVCGNEMGNNVVDQELVNKLVAEFCASSNFENANNLRKPSNWLERMNKTDLENSDGKLSYYVGGHGEKTVMIINAYGQSLYFWNNIADRLLDDYRLIVWEMRGTSCVAGGMRDSFDIQQHITDAAAIVSAENIDSFHVIGWCTGPKLAIELYQRIPEKISTMTFITPAFKDYPGMKDFETRYEKNMEPVCKLAQQNPAIATSARRSLSAILAGKNSEQGEMTERVETILSLMSEKLRTLVVAPFVNDESLLNYSKQLLKFWAHDVSVSIDKVKAPVMLITGENDEIASPELANRVVANMHDYRRYQITGGNHYIHYEKSDAVYQLMRHFMDEPGELIPELPGVEAL